MSDLVICKQLSRGPGDYVCNTHQAVAAKQLWRRGVKVCAGQTVKYVIVDADNRRPERRIMVLPFVCAAEHYDVGEYLRLLTMSLSTILSPLGVTEESLALQVRGLKQTRLS